MINWTPLLIPVPSGWAIPLFVLGGWAAGALLTFIWVDLWRGMIDLRPRYGIGDFLIQVSMLFVLWPLLITLDLREMRRGR